jgi:hypothetical protein
MRLENTALSFPAFASRREVFDGTGTGFVALPLLELEGCFFPALPGGSV